jgi:hypothetical protein
MFFDILCTIFIEYRITTVLKVEQQLTWSLIFYEKYSTSQSYLWFWPPLIFGGFSNFYRYYTRSQTGKSTGYRPTLKPLPLTIWPVTSFKLFIVHAHGYILVTIGSGFLFWNQNFCFQISTVCYFNKVRYLFGMNNFAADWMNKFPNRGRYQIANIISWQNSLYSSPLSTSSVIFSNFNN